MKRLSSVDVMSPPRMTTASGCEALFGSAQDQLTAKRHALLPFEMLVVADQHDAVAGGDPNHGHEPDERAEGEDRTRQPARLSHTNTRSRARGIPID